MVKIDEPQQKTGIALCYVRQSWTKDGDDRNSPQRQRENIEHVCKEYGWTPEWFGDVQGHKSGTEEKNRPEWLRLYSNLSKPGVVAVVANDLSRLHRKGWRVSKLLDDLSQRDIKVVLAAPGRQIDFSSPVGRALAQISAVFDEWYATDISMRARDSIAKRKEKGITVGRPPFGTMRDGDGRLIPSNRGAWELPDHTFVAGVEGERPPVDTGDTIWHGYFESAEAVLKLYGRGNRSFNGVAQEMNRRGHPYRTDKGVAVPMKGQHVRNIIENWREYGGIVLAGRARGRKDRSYIIDKFLLNPDRAVIDIRVLERVADVQANRAKKKSINDGVKAGDYPYPLSGTLYCAHCVDAAVQSDPPTSPATLSGKGEDVKLRYRHVVKSCSSHNASITGETIHHEVLRLLGLFRLALNPADIKAALRSHPSLYGTQRAYERAMQKRREEIARRERQIAANAVFAKRGDKTMPIEKFLSEEARLLAEIEELEAAPLPFETLVIDLAQCFDDLNTIMNLWGNSSDERRKQLTQAIFSRIVLDLDTKRITSFELKPWAKVFLHQIGPLYEAE